MSEVSFYLWIATKLELSESHLYTNTHKIHSIHYTTGNPVSSVSSSTSRQAAANLDCLTSYVLGLPLANSYPFYSEETYEQSHQELLGPKEESAQQDWKAESS